MYNILREQIQDVKQGYIPLHYSVGGALIANPKKPENQYDLKVWDAKHVVSQNMDALLRLNYQLDTVNKFILRYHEGKTVNKFSVVKNHKRHANAMVYQIERLISKFTDRKRGAPDREKQEVLDAKMVERQRSLNKKLAVLDQSMVHVEDIVCEDIPHRESDEIKDRPNNEVYDPTRPFEYNPSGDELILKNKGISVVRFEPVFGFYQNDIENLKQVRQQLMCQRKIVEMVLNHNKHHVVKEKDILDRWFGFFKRKMDNVYNTVAAV